MQAVYNFGREHAANREALQRLVASVTRFLDPDAALACSYLRKHCLIAACSRPTRARRLGAWR